MPNSCKKRVHAWVKKFDAHGTVKNLNKKSNSRAAQSGLKKVHDEATIGRCVMMLKTHHNGALGSDHESQICVVIHSVEYSGVRIDLGK